MKISDFPFMVELKQRKRPSGDHEGDSLFPELAVKITISVLFGLIVATWK